MSINEYCVRDAPPPPNADIRFYDLGLLTVATGNNPSNDQIGDLWITYEVEFFQPKVPVSNDTCFMEHRTFAGFPGIDRPVFGTHALSTNNSTLGSVTNGGNRFSFDPTINSGLFLVSWVNNADTAVAAFIAVGPPLVGTGCNLVKDFGICPNDGALTITRSNQMCLVEVTSRGAYFDPAPFTYPNGDCRLVVTLIPPNAAVPTLACAREPDVFMKALPEKKSDISDETDSDDSEDEMLELQRRLAVLTSRKSKEKR